MQKLTVLFVEDDIDDQELVQQIVNEEDSIIYELHICQHGEDALMYLQTIEILPTLIVSDVNMPLLDGFELKRLINLDQRKELMQVPFIFLTTSLTDLAIDGFFESFQNH